MPRYALCLTQTAVWRVQNRNKRGLGVGDAVSAHPGRARRPAPDACVTRWRRACLLLAGNLPGVAVPVVQRARQVDRPVGDDRVRPAGDGLGERRVLGVRPQEVVRDVVVNDRLELGVDVLPLGLIRGLATRGQQLVGLLVAPADEVVAVGAGLGRDLVAAEDRAVVRIERRRPTAEVRVELVGVRQEREQDGREVARGDLDLDAALLQLVSGELR